MKSIPLVLALVAALPACVAPRSERPATVSASEPSARALEPEVRAVPSEVEPAAFPRHRRRCGSQDF